MYSNLSVFKQNMFMDISIVRMQSTKLYHFQKKVRKVVQIQSIAICAFHYCRRWRS